MQANLGAKNHATVMMNDADRNSTIKALVGAAFGAAGQRCMALSVVILVGEAEEARGWVEEMAGEAKKLKVGNGFVDGVDVGELRVGMLIGCVHVFNVWLNRIIIRARRPVDQQRRQIKSGSNHSREHRSRCNLRPGWKRRRCRGI